MEFSLEKFDPTKAELENMVSEYKELCIWWVDDEDGYTSVKVALKNLSAKRVFIQKTLKWYREEALNFQKAVIAKEKELTWIIIEVEDELKSKKIAIDDEKEIIKRTKALENRKITMEEAWVKATDEFILSLSLEEFKAWIVEEKERLFTLEKAKLEEERRKLERDKELMAIEKDKQRIREEEAAKAKKREAELKAQAKVREAQLKKEAEDARAQAKIQAEKAKKEADERIEIAAKKAKIEAEAKVEADNKLRKIKEEEEKRNKIENEKIKKEWLANSEEYTNWLTTNDFNEDTDIILDEWSDVVMYRKVSVFWWKEESNVEDERLPDEDEKELFDWFWE